MKMSSHTLLARLRSKRIIPNPSGFTIVELLVVIVVIGILVAITVVSYSNITGKATSVSLMSDLENSSKILKLDQVSNNTFPNTLADANSGRGISASSGTLYSYGVNNSISPATFCLSATKNQTTYKITNNSSPVLGDCLDFGLMFYVDAGNVSSYPGSGTIWTDLSGNGRNGGLVSGVGYTSTDGGALTFDGLSQFVTFPVGGIAAMNSFSASAWIYVSGDGSSGINGIMNGKAFRFFINNSTNYLRSQINGATPYDDSTTRAILRNQWENLAFSYDGTNRLYYINGAQVIQTPTTGVSTNTQDGEVGSIQGATYALNGKVGSARLYNRALTATEFQTIFSQLRGRYGL